MSPPQASCWAQGTPVCTQASIVAKEDDKVGSASSECQMSHGQCSNFSLCHDQNHLKINEFPWKDVANALSLGNMVLGLFSIFCSFSRKSHCASWMLLMSFLLDMEVGALTRHLNICCKTGAKLNDFAVFITFGLASGLLLGVDGPLNGFVAIIYVLTTSFCVCFYSSGVPFSYRGLPCPYASCVLASISLLTKGNTFILCCMALLMILFMIEQSYYPRDDVLESENWKKVVYVGGVTMLFFSPFSLTAFYCLMWSLSYIFFPHALWGRADCLKL
ncbi:transmembrane protein 269 isoform X1 [Heterocephalus glaber]|uniref:Transmembrane protein 269 isoform X1 n=1 Tax=Heterocephalus glaber TaxID=10181 RepID=A0AAX6QFD5_HETGA|nr:transmembrane protein 269 isoform X1 [Heterocephalus glaber]